MGNNKASNLYPTNANGEVRVVVYDMESVRAGIGKGPVERKTRRV